MPGPYPLASLACTVDANGISAPPYADIFASLQASYFGIYGSDADLDPDTQDGQWIGVIAKAIDDSNQMAIATYNNFSPATAVGVGLSSVVKTNGLRREISSNSQVDVEVVGQVGRTILSGIIGDNVNLGTQWSLPAAFTIPLSGTITVQAICLTPGAVAAAPGTLTQILTPQPGWQTVTNAVAAALGAPVEVDAQLRLRQSISTAISSQYPLDAIEAAVANLSGVLRSKSYQNDTGTTDVNGIPARSISVVVSGGDPIAIAQTIALKKAPGVPTYGTTSELVIDAKGVPNTINFFVLSTTEIRTVLYLTALTGFVTGTETMIQASIAAFINALDIGDDVYRGQLFSPGNLSGSAAVLATGSTQAQLDVLTETYNLTDVAQARSDMVVTGGPYAAGATVINVTNHANYAIGQLILIVLDNGVLWRALLSNVVGTALTFAPAIPGGRSAQNGALVYVFGDVGIAFNEVAFALPTDTTLVVA